MPFVKKTELKASGSAAENSGLFVGRETELKFFIEKILKPEDPAFNIVSIFGNGGVGKSTLLSRFVQEIRSGEYKDYCLSAFVDERQTTPALVMEKFAEQLRDLGYPLGEFEKASLRYREVLRKLQMEKEAGRDTLIRGSMGIAGAVAGEVPVVGGMLKEGTKLATDYVLKERQARQLFKDALLLDNPLADLTKTFVSDLNSLTGQEVKISNTKERRFRRIILFFDTFEQLALEVAPWLLDYLLEDDVSSNVVLIIAGREAVERSTPDDPKRWLVYQHNNTIYPVSLDSFNYEETRIYLAQRGVTEAERVETIWQLSSGLPLYLGFLTSNPQAKIDPTKDVVDNFLRWIPKDEPIKRQLALDVSLLSRPFNLDELVAFPYVAENQRASLYQWLINLPFVKVDLDDGRHTYHELARELFSRHLYQRSRDEYHATRRVLAQYYEQRLKRLLEEARGAVYESTEWLELTTALVYQLLLLPDENSHVKAIEQVIRIYINVKEEQMGELSRFLRDLSQLTPHTQANSNARLVATKLLVYIGDERKLQELIEATNFLLNKVSQDSDFWGKGLASIYYKQGRTYYKLKEYELALTALDYSLKLNPDYSNTYYNLGASYYQLNYFEKAIVNFNQALQLEPDNAWTYFNRGRAYLWLNRIEEAQKDFLKSWELDKTKTSYGWMLEWLAMSDSKPDAAGLKRLERVVAVEPEYYLSYACRAVILIVQNRFEEALVELDRFILPDRRSWDGYFWKGMALAYLDREGEAVEALEKALQSKMSPALLRPLNWLKKDKEEFYRKYGLGLLTRYNLV